MGAAVLPGVSEALPTIDDCLHAIRGVGHCCKIVQKGQLL